MRRGFWLVLALALGLAAAEGGGRLLWLKLDAKTHALVFSDGTPAPTAVKARAVPGQYLVAVPGRIDLTRVWRPPADIVKTFTPKGASRVVFSHERHFAALGAKAPACATCHRTLKPEKVWPSRKRPDPHGPKSLGRFCATCHDGKTRAAKIPGAKPPIDVVVFSAFGPKGAKRCRRCHVPRDHGRDFTPGHSERAEGGALGCAGCHRGADRVARGQIDQARTFFQAQMKLRKNPEDAKAFGVTLPNSFCAYCHGVDLRAWYGE